MNKFHSLLILLTILFSCTREICGDTECSLNGILTWIDEDCSCECLAGFAGTSCDSSIIASVKGVYSTSDTCINSNSLDVRIKDAEAFQLNLLSFLNGLCGNGEEKIVAGLVNDLITIDTQFVCLDSSETDHYLIFGDGSLQYNDTLSLSYTLLKVESDTTFSQSCTQTWVKP